MSMNCISVENMRKSDQATIREKVPSLELMRRAAAGIRMACDFSTDPVVICVGSGNNGGDGFALAEILRNEGMECQILTVSDHWSKDSSYYKQRAELLGAEVLPYEAGTDQMEGAAVIVDCLLGTGFQGEVRGKYKQMIEEINQSEGFVISCDINSGMNGDSGQGSLIVHSDLTVTIGYVKTGLITENAGKFMDMLTVADIGIDLDHQEDEVLSENVWKQLTMQKTADVKTLDDGTKYLERADHRGFRCPEWLDTVPVVSR
ncbi:MAG: NAD(P)H-hydrate epimerase [Eubacterium sp.]